MRGERAAAQRRRSNGAGAWRDLCAEGSGSFAGLPHHGLCFEFSGRVGRSA
jgi:hypothetical protein